MASASTAAVGRLYYARNSRHMGMDLLDRSTFSIDSRGLVLPLTADLLHIVHIQVCYYFDSPWYYKIRISKSDGNSFPVYSLIVRFLFLKELLQCDL